MRNPLSQTLPSQSPYEPGQPHLSVENTKSQSIRVGKKPYGTKFDEVIQILAFLCWDLQ